LGLQLLEWTKTKGDEASGETLRGNDLWICFPIWHDSNDKLDKLDILGTNYYILAKLGWSS